MRRNYAKALTLAGSKHLAKASGTSPHFDLTKDTTWFCALAIIVYYLLRWRQPNHLAQAILATNCQNYDIPMYYSDRSMIIVFNFVFVKI
jgi:hypothetical protein